MLTPLRKVFDRVDAVLAGSAAIGLALYLFVVPSVHPDRAARDHAPRDSVVEAGRTFLRIHTGGTIAGDPSQARIRRDAELLDSLQRAVGRTEAVRLVRSEGVPAYYWEIALTEIVRDDDAGGGTVVGVTTDSEMEEIASIHLTLDGRPFGLSLDESFSGTGALHHDILRSLTPDSLQRVLIDSVGAERWTFRFNDPPATPSFRGARGGDDRSLNDPPELRPFYLRPEARVLLNQADAAALARYHLGGTLFADAVAQATARIDSVTASGRDGRTTASVHLSSIDSAPGERFSAVMEIAPTGGLLRLDPNFTGTAASNGADVSDVLDMIQVVTYLILIILAFFVFLRRIRYQLIDVGSAARDGLIGGVAAGIALGGRILSEVPWSLSFELLMAFFGIAVIALLAGVLIFFLSSTATSSVRDEWNEKMQTLDLVRGAYVRNVPVGRSLVRGALMGLSIVGLLAAALTLLPVDSLILSSDPLFFTSAVPGTDFMIAAMSAVFLTIFVAYLVVVGPAAIIRARTSSPTIVIGVVALTLLITQISPLDVHPVAYSFALSGVIGLVLGWTLWRFDVLSLIVSLFVFTLLWDVVPGWVVTSTPEFVGAGLSLLLVGGLVVLGGVGVAGGRTGDDIPTIVPDYIEELTRKERLERELELARSMQLSFLPRANPEMEGLDIASVCLPAYDVGGDYYDFFELDDRTLAFVVGDVSGKGMEAAFYMTLMKGILQSLVHEGARPARVLTRANAIFRRNAARDTFMSMALCVIDLEEGTLTFARAGHNPLLLRKAAGRLEVVKPAGAALGLTEPAMFEASIEEVTFHLDEGDVVIVYTDGVTEAMNPRRELYGEDRLEAAVAIQTGAEQDDASRLVRRIVDDVNGFRRNAPSHDDMTLLVVRRVNTDHSPDHSSSSR